VWDTSGNYVLELRPSVSLFRQIKYPPSAAEATQRIIFHTGVTGAMRNPMIRIMAPTTYATFMPSLTLGSAAITNAAAPRISMPTQPLFSGMSRLTRTATAKAIAPTPGATAHQIPFFVVNTHDLPPSREREDGLPVGRYQDQDHSPWRRGAPSPLIVYCNLARKSIASLTWVTAWASSGCSRRPLHDGTRSYHSPFAGDNAWPNVVTREVWCGVLAAWGSVGVAEDVLDPLMGYTAEVCSQPRR